MLRNIKDVAKLAGVSKACISKYLNNKPYVSASTRKKIEEAIKKLNFKPSAIARSLVSKKTNCIGLLIRDITNPFYASVIRGMEKFISENNYNYNLILSDMIKPDKSSNRYIDVFLERRVDGIVTTSDELSLKYLNILKNIGVPLLFILRYINESKVDVNYIIVDNYKGAYLMTEYLIKLGHKIIANISADIKSTVFIDRLNGYKQALKDYSLEINEGNILYSDSPTDVGGYKIAEKLLSKKNKPTAIFCINDFTAFGVIDYCLRNNINVPGDISVAGFDDVSFSSLDFVSLTTVKQPIEEIGRLAAEVLINKIQNGDKEKVKRILKPEIVIRKSTGPIK